MGTEDTLASEARGRRLAAWAAFIAALATIAALIVPTLAFDDTRPLNGPLSSIDTALRSGPVADAPSQRTDTVRYVQDNYGGAISSAVAQSLAYLLIGVVLFYLAQFTRSRTEKVGRLIVSLPLLGGTLAALSTALAAIGRDQAFDEYMAGPRTVDAYGDISAHPLLVSAEVLGLGTVIVALAFFFVCLNAMRVGLLTRFMGVLGIICGLLVIIPAGSQLIVQTLWLLAVGLLLLGFWPGGLPPAWVTGRAEPWPTQQEIREARERAREGGRGAKAERPATAPERREPAGVGARSDGMGTPHPSSKKKRRKRRA